METHDVIVTTTDAEPDFQALRAMLSDKPAEAPATEPEPAAEPVKEASDVTETDPGPVEPKTEPEVVEKEIPEGVKKRLKKIDDQTAAYDKLIAERISARKAKEDELKKLEGSEPVKNTAKAEPSDGEPVAPNPSDFTGSWGEYLEADAKFRKEWATWLQTETRKTVEQELTAKQALEESKRAWSEGAKAHSDLQEMAEAVVANSPEPLQLAISALDNWAGVTVHLGKNPVELEALVRAFQTNPYKGVADLGKLEARLSTSSKQAEPPKAEKPLPAPLKPVAGSASASKPNVDLEKADDKTFMAELRSMSKLTKAS